MMTEIDAEAPTWVTVPREPTSEMYKAGIAKMDTVEKAEPDEIYRAMLKAAPSFRSAAGAQSSDKPDESVSGAAPREQPTERKAFEAAMRETWQMVNPLRPPPAGTYAMGEHNGICAALKTVRENFERHAALAAAPQEQPAPCGNTPYDEGPFTIAEPGAYVPTDEEILRCNYPTHGPRHPDDCIISAPDQELIAFAHAVLARVGERIPQPEAQPDAARLNWLTRQISGKALRDAGVVWPAWSPECARAAIDAATMPSMAKWRAIRWCRRCCRDSGSYRRPDALLCRRCGDVRMAEELAACHHL